MLETNYWAVLVAALAAMVIGMLWYGPLFGKRWMNLAGLTPKSMKKMKLSPMFAMVLGFVATLVTAYVLSISIGVFKLINLPFALKVAFWLWLGFVAPVQLGVFLWEGKSFKLFVLNTSYNLVSLLAMAAILASWP